MFVLALGIAMATLVGCSSFFVAQPGQGSTQSGQGGGGSVPAPGRPTMYYFSTDG
jgi:hypothetical protein